MLSASVPPLSTIAGAALLFAHFGRRALFHPFPKARSLKERLAMLPLADAPVGRDVTIHWNDHQIPFVDADRDEDLAVALGVVHAHLRLGQMELIRRIARARLAEMAGPAALDLDHFLHILDPGRAVPEIEAGLPDETRMWLEAFVRGVNHVVQRSSELPHEFAVLGLGRETWSVADVLAMGRLVSADVNWLLWFRFLRLQGKQDWPDIWARLNGKPALQPAQSQAQSNGLSQIAAALGFSARWASNSAAVSAARSSTGNAILANDPHLGLLSPGPWIIVGAKSPERHVVGLMPPGMPFFALARNEWIAWGGTNLMAASSDFVDVSGLDERSFASRPRALKVRWWGSRTVAARDTEFGPVVSDARLTGLDRKKPVALNWMGHRPSDEFSAMLGVSRARTMEEFGEAIDGIAVSGQTMTCAAVDGRVGKAMAVRLPERSSDRLDGLLKGPDSARDWQRSVTGAELPASWNPPEGFIVSANDEPARTRIPVGYFFAPPARAARMAELITARAKMDAEDLEAVLTDVYGPTAHALARAVVELLDDGTEPSGIRALLAAWNGRYEADSKGALALELVVHAFVPNHYSADMQSALWAVWDPYERLLEDIRGSAPETVRPAFCKALREAERHLAGLGTWGGMHRFRLAHPFAMVPVFGRRYVTHDFAASGNRGTVQATNGTPGVKRHRVVYGTGARNVFDLADPDRNRIVLLGGQDGWLGSSTANDQVDLWRAGQVVEVPMRLETVKERFSHRTVLVP